MKRYNFIEGQLNRMVSVSIMAAAVIAMLGCKMQANAINGKTVSISSFNGALEKIDLAVPFDHKRLASLDIIDNLGLGDRVVGTAKTSLDYFKINIPKIKKLQI